VNQAVLVRLAQIERRRRGELEKRRRVVGGRTRNAFRPLQLALIAARDFVQVVYYLRVVTSGRGGVFVQIRVLEVNRISN